MPTPTRRLIYHALDRLNRLFCRVMYRVTPPPIPPLPDSGPVLLVSDHSSFSDPMVLVATSQRPIIFLTAREIYERRFLRWFCRTVNYIPVSRGSQDVGAVRAMLRARRSRAICGWEGRLYHEGKERRFGSFKSKTNARDFFEKAKPEQKQERFFPERYRRVGTYPL